MKYIVLFSLLLISCSNAPTRYHQLVVITGGDYKGKRGELISDCPGIENYKVIIDDDFIKETVCIRIWNMEAL